jgi:hypothetical protein
MNREPTYGDKEKYLKPRYPIHKKGGDASERSESKN